MLSEPAYLVLEVFATRRRDGSPPPTFREIAEVRGYRSCRAAADLIETLLKEGALIAQGEPRQSRRYQISDHGFLLHEERAARLALASRLAKRRASRRARGVTVRGASA